MLYDVGSLASTTPKAECYANVHPDCKEGTTFRRPFLDSTGHSLKLEF